MSLIISQFSSLSFDRGWKRRFQTDVSYVQEFLRTDKISVHYAYPQLMSIGVSIKYQLTDLTTGLLENIEGTQISLGLQNAYRVYRIVLENMTEGDYRLEFITTIDGKQAVAASSDFSIRQSLDDTVLLRYSNDANDFDEIFNVGTTRYWHELRLPGAFLPSEMQSMVDTEVFRDQRAEVSQLFALPYNKYTLTVGGGYGVPNWAARKLNMIFALSDVTVDGVKHTRSEGSAPEATAIHPDYPLYIYKIELERDDNWTEEFQFLRHVTLTPSTGIFTDGGGTGSEQILALGKGNIDFNSKGYFIK